MQSQILGEKDATGPQKLTMWFLGLTPQAGTPHLVKNIENQWAKNLFLEVNFEKSV